MDSENFDNDVDQPILTAQEVRQRTMAIQQGVSITSKPASKPTSKGGKVTIKNEQLSDDEDATLRDADSSEQQEVVQPNHAVTTRFPWKQQTATGKGSMRTLGGYRCPDKPLAMPPGYKIPTEAQWRTRRTRAIKLQEKKEELLEGKEKTVMIAGKVAELHTKFSDKRLLNWVPASSVAEEVADATVFSKKNTLLTNACLHDLFDPTHKDKTWFNNNNPLPWILYRGLCESMKGCEVDASENLSILLAENTTDNHKEYSKLYLDYDTAISNKKSESKKKTKVPASRKRKQSTVKAEAAASKRVKMESPVGGDEQDDNNIQSPAVSEVEPPGAQASNQEPQPDVAELQAGVEKQDQQLMSEDDEASKLRADHVKLMADYDELRADHEKLRADHDELRADHDELRQDLRNLKRDVSWLKKFSEDTKTSHRTLSGNFNRSKALTNRRLDDLEKKTQPILEFDDASSDAASVIPSSTVVSSDEDFFPSIPHNDATSNQLLSSKDSSESNLMPSTPEDNATFGESLASGSSFESILTGHYNASSNGLLSSNDSSMSDLAPFPPEDNATFDESPTFIDSSESNLPLPTSHDNATSKELLSSNDSSQSNLASFAPEDDATSSVLPKLENTSESNDDLLVSEAGATYDGSSSIEHSLKRNVDLSDPSANAISNETTQSQIS